MQMNPYSAQRYASLNVVDVPIDVEPPFNQHSHVIDNPHVHFRPPPLRRRIAKIIIAKLHLIDV